MTNSNETVKATTVKATAKDSAKDAVKSKDAVKETKKVTTVKETKKATNVKESKKVAKKEKPAKEPKKVIVPDMKKVRAFVKLFLRTDIERTIMEANLKESIKIAKRNDVSPKEIKKYQNELDNFQIWPDEIWAEYDNLNEVEQSIAYEISENVERLVRRIKGVTKDADELQKIIKDCLSMLSI